MRISTKIVMRIETGEVLYSEGFDYKGPIALCKGDDMPQYDQQNITTPQQQEMWALLKPIWEQISNRWTSGQSLFDYPSAPGFPDLPSMKGVLSDIPMYDIPEAVSPGKGWWSGLDTDIKGGIMEPWQAGQEQLFEFLGSKGMAGGPRGVSPTAGGAMADYWSDAMTKIPTQGWGMVAPGLQEERQNVLGQNILGYQNLTKEAMGDYGSETQRLMADWQNAISQWGMGQQGMMNIPGMAGGMIQGTYPTPMMTEMPQGGSGWLDALMGMGGAGLGILGGSYLGAKGQQWGGK